MAHRSSSKRANRALRLFNRPSVRARLFYVLSNRLSWNKQQRFLRKSHYNYLSKRRLQIDFFDRQPAFSFIFLESHGRSNWHQAFRQILEYFIRIHFLLKFWKFNLNLKKSTLIARLIGINQQMAKAATRHTMRRALKLWRRAKAFVV